jgi:DNA integrity scanning protein DisA with diadenylate cyclase activity
MDFAAAFAKELNAKAILISSDVVPEDFSVDDQMQSRTILVWRKEKETEKPEGSFGGIIEIPNVRVTPVSQMKIAIIKGMTAGMFGPGDKMICLTGSSRLDYIENLFVVDVDSEFEILSSGDMQNIFEGIQPEVFDSVLNVALELAAQGREGRPVGTIFVIGDHEKVMGLSRQMIINPFMGYNEEERNIMNYDLKETIKEFSALDGAFVIKENGVLITAGRHLNVALENGKEFPKGLGSRHIVAAGITNVTNAIAIVVSESTGTVRIFRKGKIFVDIEKALG